MNTTSSKSEKYRLHYPYSVSSQRYLTNTFEQQKPTYTYYSNDISPPPLISHKTMGYPTTIETRPLTQITHSPIMSYTTTKYIDSDLNDRCNEEKIQVYSAIEKELFSQIQRERDRNFEVTANINLLVRENNALLEKVNLKNLEIQELKDKLLAFQGTQNLQSDKQRLLLEQTRDQVSQLNEELVRKTETIKTLENLSADQASEIQIWKDNYDKLEKQYKTLQSQSQLKIEEQEQNIQNLNQQLNSQMNLNWQYSEEQDVIHSEKQKQLQLITDMTVQIKGLEKSASKASNLDVRYYEQEIANLKIKLKETQDQYQIQSSIQAEYKNLIQNQQLEINTIRSQLQDNTQQQLIINDLQQKVIFLKAENQRLNNILLSRCSEFPKL